MNPRRRGRMVNAMLSWHSHKLLSWAGTVLNSPCMQAAGVQAIDGQHRKRLRYTFVDGKFSTVGDDCALLVLVAPGTSYRLSGLLLYVKGQFCVIL